MTQEPILSLRPLIHKPAGSTLGFLCKMPFAATEKCDESTRPGARELSIKQGRLLYVASVLKQMPHLSILYQLSVSNDLHVTF